jgi:hypothetical protein
LEAALAEPKVRRRMMSLLGTYHTDARAGISALL